MSKAAAAKKNNNMNNQNENPARETGQTEAMLRKVAKVVRAKDVVVRLRVRLGHVADIGSWPSMEQPLWTLM